MDPITLAAAVVVLVVGAAMSGGATAFDIDKLLFGALVAAVVGVLFVLGGA